MKPFEKYATVCETSCLLPEEKTSFLMSSLRAGAQDFYAAFMVVFRKPSNFFLASLPDASWLWQVSFQL